MLSKILKPQIWSIMPLGKASEEQCAPVSSQITSSLPSRAIMSG
jgi:hypothetical protein